MERSKESGKTGICFGKDEIRIRSSRSPLPGDLPELLCNIKELHPSAYDSLENLTQLNNLLDNKFSPDLSPFDPIVFRGGLKLSDLERFRDILILRERTEVDKGIHVSEYKAALDRLALSLKLRLFSSSLNDQLNHILASEQPYGRQEIQTILLPSFFMEAAAEDRNPQPIRIQNRNRQLAVTDDHGKIIRMPPKSLFLSDYDRWLLRAVTKKLEQWVLFESGADLCADKFLFIRSEINPDQKEENEVPIPCSMGVEAKLLALEGDQERKRKINLLIRNTSPQSRPGQYFRILARYIFENESHTIQQALENTRLEMNLTPETARKIRERLRNKI